MPPDLEAEFDTLMARAGLTVPAEHHAALLRGYAALREQVELLHGPRTAAAEPSNVFRLPMLRGV